MEPSGSRRAAEAELLVSHSFLDHDLRDKKSLQRRTTPDARFLDAVEPATVVSVQTTRNELRLLNAPLSPAWPAFRGSRRIAINPGIDSVAAETAREIEDPRGGLGVVAVADEDPHEAPRFADRLEPDRSARKAEKISSSFSSANV